MLGLYEGFPENVHKEALFTCLTSQRKLQQTLIEALGRLNAEELDLETLTGPSTRHCTVLFEFGIAEGQAFSYVDREEVQRALKTIAGTPLKIMDMLCVLRYYRSDGARKTPLKFDHYMIRFGFNDDIVGLRVFHERGPMHVMPEEIITFIVGRLNLKSAKKTLKPLAASD